MSDRLAEVGDVRSWPGRGRRFTEREHQAIGPVEEGRGVNDVGDDFIRAFAPKGIILSGGPNSVTEGDTPRDLLGRHRLRHERVRRMEPLG